MPKCVSNLNENIFVYSPVIFKIADISTNKIRQSIDLTQTCKTGITPALQVNSESYSTPENGLRTCYFIQIS